MSNATHYVYVMSREHFITLLGELGTKLNVIKYINDTYSLLRMVTDIKVEG